MRNVAKPARLLTKLTEALRDKDAEIAELKKLAHSRRVELERYQDALNAADERVLSLRQRKAASDSAVIRLTDSAVIRLTELNDAATAALARLEAKHAAATTALRSSEVMRLSAVAERDALAAQLAAVGPQIALLESKEAALTKILDGVRDRMRRKEIEAESAILNRKAIAAVAPERNFR